VDVPFEKRAQASVSSEMRRVLKSIKKMGPEARIQFMLAAGLATQAQADKAMARLQKSARKAKSQKNG
jgi:hypothetical protein